MGCGYIHRTTRNKISNLAIIILSNINRKKTKYQSNKLLAIIEYVIEITKQLIQSQLIIDDKSTDKT